MTTEGPVVCRLCGNTDLQQVLSLGRTPLANALLTEAQLSDPEETFPLDLAFCPDCTLVQITETVSSEKLFREYFYLSSFSDTMLRHAADLAGQIIDAQHLGPNSLVVEVASNDGYLLRHYKRAGVPVMGIEPAVNIARVAEKEHGISTICEFFTEQLAERLRSDGHRADVIHANNVLAHVPDLNGFVRGLRNLLKDDGVAVIEVPYVKEMIDRCEFDTIYHEHLSYFSLTALDRLFSGNALNIFQVDRLPIHGGTLRIYVSHKHRNQSVSQLLENEADWGMSDGSFYADFRNRVECLRKDLLELLQNLKEQGKRIAVYGASAKGSTLLNYFGIGRETLDYVVDRSTVKQGLYTPGTHLQIHPPEKLLAEMPDYVLLLTWNFADEILEQQREFRLRGGRFIIPIPSVKVVTMGITFRETKLKGAFLIEPEVFRDERGVFARSYSETEFEKLGLNPRIAECNISFSKYPYTLRGMHYQKPPAAQVKLVRCTKGEIYDVIIDLRPDSPTFKQWFGEILTEENRLMMYVPEGFAHGFQTLTPDSEVFYQVSHVYSPKDEDGVRWNDPAFGITWPATDGVFLKDRDRDFPDFKA